MTNKTAVKSESQKQETDVSHSAHKPSEFRAEIIPYDTCEDPNSPILTVSGGNLNLVFSIPKESFRKLAIAVIDHLEHDPDFKPPENSDINKRTCYKVGEHSETSAKSKLTDVHDLDTSSTNGVMNVSKDGSESGNSNEDLPSTSKTDSPNHSYCNGSGGLDSESVCSDYQIDRKAQSSEIAVELDSLNNFQSTFVIPNRTSHSSQRELSKYPELVRGLSIDKECEKNNSDVVSSTNENDHVRYESSSGLVNDVKMSCRKVCEESKNITNGELHENKTENHGQYGISDENAEGLTSERNETVFSDAVNRSAHSLYISQENSSVLNNTWPDIRPFTEREEIPIKELKSLELNGVLTRYLKLELLNELVIIRVTSDSNVLVDAVKYKADTLLLSENSEDSCLDKSRVLPEKESTESFICKVCSKSVSSIALESVQKDSEDEAQNVSQIEESAICGHEDEKQACASEVANEEKMISKFANKEILEGESSERQNLKTGSDEPCPIVQAFEIKPFKMHVDVLNKMVREDEARYFQMMYNESENSSDGLEDGSPCKTNEYKTPDKDFENDKFQKMLVQKIEQKLEESDLEVPGSSPTERLIFTLSDSLKSPFNEIKTEKQTESVCDTSGIFANKSSPKTCSENFETREECLKEVNPQYVAEISKENAITLSESEQSHQIASKYLDSASPKIERCSDLKSDFISSRKKLYQSLNEDKTSIGKVNGENKIEESVSKDSLSENENSLCDVGISVETNLKESAGLSFEESNLSKKHLLDKELNVSDYDVSKSACSQFENARSKETNSCENIASVQSKMKENKVSQTKEKVTSDIANVPSKNTVRVQSEAAENAKAEENTREEIAINLEIELSENCLEGVIEYEKKLSKDISVQDPNDSIEKTFEDKLDVDKNVSVEILEHSNEVAEDIDEPDEHSEEKCGESVKTDLATVCDASQFFTESKYELNTVFKVESSDKMNDTEFKKVETMNRSEESFTTSRFETSRCEANEVSFNKPTQSVEHQPINEMHSKCSENKSSEEKNSECIENDVALNTSGDTEIKLPENSFASNGDSLIDSAVVETNSESMSEGGDLESDDVKSIASESDDSKDGEKSISVRKSDGKSKRQTDEVDCAPTRVRTRKAISGLSKDVIPEHTEVKHSKVRGSSLNVSGRTSPIGRSLRSKSLDPSPQKSKEIPPSKKYIESEEINRSKRATTPDVIAKKDIKTTMRSSPRKLVRSSAAESKVQSTKTTIDTHSKSRATLDSSLSTSKRNKRGKN